MKYLRSKEVKWKIVLLCILISLELILVGLLGNLTVVYIVTIWDVLFLVLELAGIYYRYSNMEQMCDDIDRILHGEEKKDMLADCREGELAILSVQINKMIRRLKEQTSALKKEKMLLADSMADISHQLKTPLTSMNLILTFLKEEVNLEKRRSYVRELVELIHRIEWLVYAMLRMSKLDAGAVSLKTETVYIRELIEQAYEPLVISFDVRGICMERKISEEASFRGDISWMAEAIGNILKNCMEHTSENGRITVEAEENALYTRIFIKDTGKGFQQEDIPHIFERFYRGKNAEENSVGIGLALSKKIITAHNGTIKAGNLNAEQGAFFEIRFYKEVI